MDVLRIQLLFLTISGILFCPLVSNSQQPKSEQRSNDDLRKKLQQEHLKIASNFRMTNPQVPSAIENLVHSPNSTDSFAFSHLPRFEIEGARNAGFVHSAIAIAYLQRSRPIRLLSIDRLRKRIDLGDDFEHRFVDFKAKHKKLYDQVMSKPYDEREKAIADYRNNVHLDALKLLGDKNDRQLKQQMCQITIRHAGIVLTLNRSFLGRELGIANAQKKNVQQLGLEQRKNLKTTLNRRITRFETDLIIIVGHKKFEQILKRSNIKSINEKHPYQEFYGQLVRSSDSKDTENYAKYVKSLNKQERKALKCCLQPYKQPSDLNMFGAVDIQLRDPLVSVIPPIRFRGRIDNLASLVIEPLIQPPPKKNEFGWLGTVFIESFGKRIEMTETQRDQLLALSKSIGAVSAKFAKAKKIEYDLSKKLPWQHDGSNDFFQSYVDKILVPKQREYIEQTIDEVLVENYGVMPMITDSYWAKELDVTNTQVKKIRAKCKQAARDLQKIAIDADRKLRVKIVGDVLTREQRKAFNDKVGEYPDPDIVDIDLILLQMAGIEKNKNKWTNSK